MVSSAASAGTTRWLTRALLFAAVGVSGLFVNEAIFWLMADRVGMWISWSAVLATQGSTAWNFSWVELAVYRRRSHAGWLFRYVKFAVMNNLLLLARIPALLVLVHGLGMPHLYANFWTLAVLFVVRFLVSDGRIWASGQVVRPEPVTALRGRKHDYAHTVLMRVHRPIRRGPVVWYRIPAGPITISSEVTLPELACFRLADPPSGKPDIAVVRGTIGSAAPRRRTVVLGLPRKLCYHEHFGRFGANFRVDMGKGGRVRVTVGPLMARSPHVVYTNVVEALLRAMLVTKGCVLLHSAGLKLNGTGVLLSARTDTGKTGTVLRLVRERGAEFLSDDMTIVGADGVAMCFPKPLTISAHTLRAVDSRVLTLGERVLLQVQGRLHSRSGRGIGLWLAEHNVPVISLNCLTQIAVPPPKYAVDRLVPGCGLCESVPIRHLFLIARGEPKVSALSREEALSILLRNTEDAYGFPPYKHLAPMISLAHLKADELRAREREILAEFLSHVRAITAVSSDTFDWAERIPELLGEGVSAAAANCGVSNPISYGWGEHEAFGGSGKR